MKSSQMMNGMKLTAAFLSCFTMVMSPVAMGAEAERMSRQQAEKYVIDFGLNRRETLGQFWDKNKVYAPANLYADIQKYVNENRNLLMPEVTGITASKATDGSEVATLQMSQGGKTYTIQMYGEKNRYIRINGVTLTESDLIRLRPAIARLEASDINLKKAGDKLRQVETNRIENEKAAIEYTKDFARFKGFPRITPQMWSSLSPTERAGYIVKMRLMWGDAQRVNEVFRQPAAVPAPTKKNKNHSLLEKIYEAFVGEEASAETAAQRAERLRRERVRAGSAALATTAPVGVSETGRPDSRPVISRAAVSGVTADGAETFRVAANAPQCIVAGYVGGYGTITNRGTQVSRQGCSADAAMASYRATPELAFAAEATTRCAASNTPRWVACNPIVYGYKPDGSEICVNRDADNFQDATHYPGPCDPESRLGPADTAMRFTGADYSNISRDEQLRMIEAAQRSQTDPSQDYLMTKNFLASVLAHGGNQSLKDKFQAGQWDLALDNELVRIQTAFETDINRAIVACEARLNARNEYDSRQRPACDQLHRRWLFTERFIEKIRTQGCPANSTYIGAFPTSGGRSESTYGTGGAPSTAVVSATALNKRALVNGDKLCECAPVASTPAAPPASSPGTAPLPPAQPMPPRAPAPAGTADVAPPPAVVATAGERVAFGGQCPMPPSSPPPVPPPPAPPAGTCPGSGVPISVPADGPFNFCACPRDNNVRVPIGQNVVCPPANPPVPPPGPVPPATCSQPQGIENFDYETCRCISGTLKTKNDGRRVCEGNNNTGLIIGGVALAGLAAFLLLRKHDHDPQCAAGTTYNPTTRVCACTAVACDLTTNDYNPASCSCTPKTVVPPVTCPNPAQTNVNGVCQCVSASLCTAPQKVYDYQTCQCTDKPEPPKCENGSLAPDGLIAKCPIKCPDNSYVTPPATCPPPTEGGTGTPKCYENGVEVDCGVGGPGTGR